MSRNVETRKILYTMLEIITRFHQRRHPLDMSKFTSSKLLKRGGVRYSVFPNPHAFGFVHRDESTQLVQFICQRIMPSAVEYMFVAV